VFDIGSVDTILRREAHGDVTRLTHRIHPVADLHACECDTQGLRSVIDRNAKLVGETAPGIEERLGPEYGDYARKAASAIENAANTIAEKNADELIEDTRDFVRNSPGIALAGAAVIGFVVARLLKTGLAKDDDDED